MDVTAALECPINTIPSPCADAYRGRTEGKTHHRCFSGTSWSVPAIAACLFLLLTCSSSVFAQQQGWQPSDYDGNDSPLIFKRLFLPSGSMLPSVLGPAWYHNFDMMLTGDATARTIHLPEQTIVFLPASFPENTAPPPTVTPAVRWVEKTNAPASTAKTSQHSGSTAFAAQPNADILLGNNIQHTWLRQDGWLYHFTGSFLTSMVQPALGQKITLRYRDRLLSSVTDQQGNHMRLYYRRGQLESVEWPNQSVTRFEYGIDGVLETFSPSDQPATYYDYRSAGGARVAQRPTGHCIPDDTNEPLDSSDESTSCDIEAHPPPEGFLNGNSTEGEVHLDLRPASCESYFADVSGIDRGQAIESALSASDYYNNATATVSTYPVADFLINGEVIAVISRDLASPSYTDPNRPDALYDTLMNDGADIHERLLEPIRINGSLSATVNGETTTITDQDIDQPVLEVVVQFGAMSEQQRQAIERAQIDLAERYGITLRVVFIP